MPKRGTDNSPHKLLRRIRSSLPSNIADITVGIIYEAVVSIRLDRRDHRLNYAAIHDLVSDMWTILKAEE